VSKGPKTKDEGPRTKGKGVEFVSPPQEQPYGAEAVFKDGCGNTFSLTQHR
jgi:hypothetical protein